MSNGSLPLFPDYGESGDMAGARRARRAYRFCILFAVLFTGMLWFAENFLLYDHPERLFRSALTLPRESARVLLLQAIKADEETRERPAPQYTQALAVRAENDIVLTTYEEAFQMEPDNAPFAVRYGCQLFIMGRPERAHAIFEHAARESPDNALPQYLEAASVAEMEGEAGALEDAMVIVARTNNSGQPIIFPRPIWFTPGLPRDGLQYAEQSRGIVDQVCAPLYQLLNRVESALEEDPPPNAKSWLSEMRVMGERLVAKSEPRGTLQAIAGLTIQLRAIEQLTDLAEVTGQPAPEELEADRTALQSALERVKAFEAEREERIESARAELMAPLQLLGAGIVAVFAIYAFAMVIHKLMGLKKSAWTVSHSMLAKGVLGGGIVFLLFLLHVVTMFQRIAGSQQEYVYAVSAVFVGVVAIMALFGVVYPATRLENPQEVSRRTGRPEEFGHLLHFARRAYRRAYFSLALRYYGILSGLFLGLGCAWMVTYRIAVGLYPWQFQLLTPGLLERETAVVRELLTTLP